MNNVINHKTAGTALCSIFAFALLISAGFAQTIDESILKDFSWRNIGPANMGGRTIDIEAVESNPKIIYAATATSGLWKTVNRGTTWEPIFDDQPVGSIGDIAVSQKNPNIIYVGTGEANNRNSSPWGSGIYKSTDAGETWVFVGLKETHHIGRILIDPENTDIVYVAALGHLWGTNVMRGVYKTTNGGRTWDKVFYIDERTGVTDLAMDPEDNGTLYAAAHERLRDLFDAGDPVNQWGPGAGIYVSRDAGENWTKATEGLPTVEMGRIGLSISQSKPGTIYALISVISTRSAGGGSPAGGQRGQQEELDPNRGGIFKSTDYGKTWTQQSTYNIRPSYYSQIRVDPNNDDVLWICGTALGYTEDGGKTVRSGAQISGPTHIDYHAIWINPNDSEHVLLGSDGGINVTYDGGRTWDLYMQQPMAQFYAITADMRKPYYVYGGLQDNGSWGGPSRVRSRYGIRNENWYMLSWGDGFFAQVDPTDFNIVYTESQGGALGRSDLRTGQRQSIRPGTNNIVNYEQYYPRSPQEEPQEARARGRGPFRFDWNSPLLLSSHNPNTLYFGGNHLFKSVNRGDNWMIISPDLTSTPDKPSAIVSIDESPLNPSVVWAGTNDGNVWLTRDGGVNWRKLNAYISGAPEKYWVKRLEASNHVEGRAYLVFDGHRNDDFYPHIFVTEDFGETWKNITGNLPEGSSFVVREDYKNPDLLFAGTSNAVYVSLDRGENWTRFMNNMPTVEVHDLFIHPRDGDLIAGTHGRGAWICDDITPLQQLTTEVADENAYLFEGRTETLWASPSGQYPYQTDKEFKGENPPNGPFIGFYFKAKPFSAELVISDITGELKRTIKLVEEGAGIYKYRWDRRFDPTTEQITRFIAQTKETLDRLIEQAETEEQRGQLRQLSQEFDRAGTDLELIRGLQERLTQLTRGAGAARGGAAGRGARGGGLQGATAGIGEYLVTFNVDGKTMTTTLVIEEDNPGYIIR